MLPDTLVDRVRGEYREMPGLRLTLPQACRLWNLDSLTCGAVLDQLVRENFLRLAPGGAFVAAQAMRKALKADLDSGPPLRRRA